jgi:beta-glucosidase
MSARRLLIALALVGAAIPVAPAAAAGRCGGHAWCDTGLTADQRADLLLKALTPSERVGLLGGDDLGGVTSIPHTGTEDGVPRIGLPPTYYSDGPAGVRGTPATAFPAPLALAASFSPSLANLVGRVIADEAKRKGNDVVFAPTVNIMRTPYGGRTFEGYGEDPLLTSRLGVAWIKGAQSQGVIANVKHYAANNQEGRNGIPPLTGLDGSRLLVDAKVDERTLREIYLPQFEAAVKDARVGSVMCSYNRLNGTWACENRRLLETILRKEWGFRGYVLADYAAAHNTRASLGGGLDFEPWPPIAYQPLLIDAMLLTGIRQSVVDQHVHRVLRTLFAYGFFDRPAFPVEEHKIDVAGHAEVARRVEEQGITLLQNDGVLPIDTRKVRSIAVVGPEADAIGNGGGSSAVTAFRKVTPDQGIARRAGPGVQVRTYGGNDVVQATATVAGADVAIVIAGDQMTEGIDKNCLQLTCNGIKDRFVESITAANPNTVVVLTTGGPVLTPWRNRARAVVEAWFPGQEAGSALARVLFGDVDPGGRLPATFPRSEADLPAAGDREAYPGGLEVRYKEGVLVGYRWFDQRGKTPAYPFGHGLSYTRFRFGKLAIKPAAGRATGATVALDVRNIGRRRGNAVAQLYLGMPDPRPGVVQPPRQLKGFSRASIARGKKRRLRFTLDQRSFSYWDTRTDGWRVATGCYPLMVGTSSRAPVRRAMLAVGGARCGKAVAIPGKAKKKCKRKRGSRRCAKPKARVKKPAG